jgi:hypothetical protein
MKIYVAMPDDERRQTARSCPLIHFDDRRLTAVSSIDRRNTFETVTNTKAKRLFVYKTPLTSAQLWSSVLY